LTERYLWQGLPFTFAYLANIDLLKNIFKAVLSLVLVTRPSVLNKSKELAKEKEMMPLVREVASTPPKPAKEPELLVQYTQSLLRRYLPKIQKL